MVVISNGFNRFHLAVAAAEMDHRSMLSGYITGAYPTPGVEKLINGTGLYENRKFSRLINRKNNINSKLVSSLWVPEGLYAVGLRAKRIPWLFTVGENMERKGFRLYGSMAVPSVEHAVKKGAKIYHYRSGFGRESVSAAKKLGLITLCDHSIAHPEVLKYLIENKGSMPNIEKSYPVAGLWDEILKDIELADAVLVNSDFVKDTFINRGWGRDNIYVIYLGIDDEFYGYIPHRYKDNTGNRLFRILFAGGFENRKGAVDLLNALCLLEDDTWELRIAGEVSPEIKKQFGKDLENSRVTSLGWLSRQKLASEMVQADAFVFPSLAEGSARVVFEALACGCYVITTPNSGSIVKDGICGRLISPGNPNKLAGAIKEAMSSPVEVLRKYGMEGAKEVQNNYRQSHYGDSLLALYKELINKM